MWPSTLGLPFNGPGMIHRRGFLQGALAGSAATLGFSTSLRGAEAPKAPRQVIFIWLAGGASQFEMWDPKPGRPTGGPFQSIRGQRTSDESKRRRTTPASSGGTG